MTANRTMFEKIWQRHVVVDRDDGYTLLYVDRHLMHDGSAAGFAQLRERGLKLRRPDRGFATPDHYVLSNSRSVQDIPDPASPPAGRADQGEHRRERRHPVRSRRRAAGHRPCRGPGAGRHPARPDPGVRRQPYLDARRAGRARFRHRLVGSGACDGDAMPVAAQAQGHAGQRRRHAWAPASRPRTSSWRSSPRSARPARSATWSSMPAAPFAASRSKAA